MRFFVPLLPFVYAGEVDEASGAVVVGEDVKEYASSQNNNT